VGTTINGSRIHHIDELAKMNATLNAQVGIVAVTRAGAQEVVDKLVAAGVQAILNFAPVSILVRPGIVVRHVDLTSQLEVLSYYLRAK
jgi:redox-sensing transcriptional repressor